MSSPFAPSPVNPYQPPPGAGGVSPAGMKAFPVFVRVVVLADLLLLIFRALLVVGGVLGILSVGNEAPLIAQTGWFEVGSGALMVLAGFPADIAMLLRQGWAVFLAYVKVAATFASIIVGIWQMTFFLQTFQPGSPEYVGGLMGAGVTVVVRVGLLALYVAAVVWYSRWLSSSSDRRTDY
jgi:hypothetical protein